MSIRTLASVGLFALPVAAQTLTFAEGSPTALQIVSVAEGNPTGPDSVVLQGVEFLPIEVTGRTLAREFDASRSRRLVRHGIERVELPGGGRLLRYRRNGGQFYGFLHVAADGVARVVFERPGTGVALEDPFLDRIGVADDGRHAAIGLLAGGIRFVKLDGTVYASTGRPDRAAVPGSVEALPASVMVGPTHVFYITGDDEVFRCALADGGTPVDVSAPPVANGEYKDELALSRDGQHAVFLYGPRDLQRLWHIDTAAPAANLLPPAPSKYEEPGYLPDGAGEPAMLLSDDGARLFYIDADVRDELHLLDLSGVLPDLQITENQIFQPYIGAHILPKFVAHEMVVAIGDPGQMDWFRISLAAGGGHVVNLTGTGSLAQPFPSGTIDTMQATDTGSYLLITEQAGAARQLRKLDPVTSVQTIVQHDVLGAPEPGSSFAGVGDTLVRSNAGDALYRGSQAALFATTPAGVSLTSTVHGPQFAATWVHLPAIQWGIVVFYLPDGTIVSGPIEQGIEQITMTAAGGAVLRGPTLRYLAPGREVFLPRPTVPMRLVLSGAGG